MDAEEAKRLSEVALGALEGLAKGRLEEVGLSTVEGQMAHSAVHVLAWLGGLGAAAIIEAAVSREFTSDGVIFVDET